ncbi:glycosyltransferase [Roseibium sediminis]|uniref:glycosyltransferase n=1 Tax=Roseibium sediminis TaxID=1775174 RepID=UPI00123C9350|nr:glycosyltransferase [Roseibium sediminis]
MGMISVVIPTLNSETSLVQCLSSLVPAAAEGVVREVIVVDGGSQDGTHRVADAAGCSWVAVDSNPDMRLAEGVRNAGRGQWLMFLAPNVHLEMPWHNEVQSILDRLSRSGQADQLGLVFRTRNDAFGTRARLVEAFQEVKAALFGSGSDLEALLLSRRLFDEVSGERVLQERGLSGLRRKLGRGRQIRLKSAAIVQSLP